MGGGGAGSLPQPAPRRSAPGWYRKRQRHRVCIADASTMRSLWKLTRLAVREAMADRITSEAARAAYFFFLSLFPFILAVFALTGLLGGDSAFQWIMARLEEALPGQAASYLAQFVHQITGEQRPGILSFSVLLILWSASNVFAILTDGLNHMYDLEETRPWWKRRVLALVTLVVATVALIGSTLIVVSSPKLLRLVGLVGLSDVWDSLRWPAVLVLMTLFMWLVYLLLPNRRQRHSVVPTLIGAVVGTLLWSGATIGFRIYVSHFGSYSETYGFVGGIIILLLWLYLTGVAILFGGEVAATLEQMGDRDWEVGQPPPKKEGG